MVHLSVSENIIYRIYWKILFISSLVIILLLITAFRTDNVFLWKILSYLGEEYLYIILSIFIIVFLDVNQGIILLTTIVLSGSMNIIFKNLFQTPRPPSSLWRDEVSGFGFPSGHVQVSTSFWLIHTLLYQNLYSILASTIFILAITISRIALRVHYPVDVIGGLVFGVISSLIVYVGVLVLGRKSIVYYVVLTFILSSIFGFIYNDVILFKAAGLSMGIVFYRKYNDILASINNFNIKTKVVFFALSLSLVISIVWLSDFIVFISGQKILYIIFYGLLIPVFVFNTILFHRFILRCLRF